MELARTQAEGTEVVSDPTDEGMGLQIVNGLFEEQEGRVEDDDMEMDALEANLLESGFDLGAEENFQTLSEEEDEKVLAKGDEVPIQEKGLVESDINKGESKGAGDAPSKQGNQKRIFKPTSSTVGSTKMRIANALVKRAASKGVTRYGDNGKPPEAKGTSKSQIKNPKFYGSGFISISSMQGRWGLRERSFKVFTEINDRLCFIWFQGSVVLSF